jgi:hypothetical protein
MITGIRFRNEGELLVLQVESRDPDVFNHSRPSLWRDAKTTDLLEVSAHTSRDVDSRLSEMERHINSLTDKVWGED